MILIMDSCVQKEKPNIILILTDDQAYTAVGCYGNKQIKTPNIDKLAYQGIRFNNHYNTTSICMASRASIMTGMYEYKTGCNFMHGALSADKFSLSYPELLQKEGYRTGFAGKFGFAVTPEPTDNVDHKTYDRLPVEEFDWWAGGTDQTYYETSKNKYIAKYAEEFPHSSRAYGAAARDFIRESVKQEKPFCLSVSFKAPHMPFTPDPVFDTVYQNIIFNKPVNYGRENARHLAIQAKLGRQYLRFFELHKWDPENYQETIRKYFQLIYGADYAIGMITEELKKQGIDDNTIIIFTSDNGYFCGSHGFGDKVLPYEEAARAPLIIYDPRRSRSQKLRSTEAITGNIDIAPTILDLAGIPVPSNMDGKSLVPVLDSSEMKIRETLPIIQAWGTAPHMALAIVTDEWKYIYWYYGNNIDPAEELFNLEGDPFEMKNLINEEQYKETLNKMREYYDMEVQRWKEQAVPYNDYACFGILFDRHINFTEKEKLIPQKFIDNYFLELKNAEIISDPYDYKSILKQIEKDDDNL
ncbi:MAG: acetylglucosamine-6-sulfatase [Bacteroidetes bacterium RBG_13_43_22]|nr:MAG: acetylglucosamine-6-sulfatase [Bacteroidetes bacterium RBG_13_43_22]